MLDRLPVFGFQVANHIADDVSGDSENDRDTGPEEGHSEGRAGCAPALPNGDDNGCLYAADSRERTGHGQLDQSRVEEVGV
jgi:hypothetical protein